jgi:hypothetical protein
MGVVKSINIFSAPQVKAGTLPICSEGWSIASRDASWRYGARLRAAQG